MAEAGNGSFLKGLTGSAVNLTFKGFRGITVVSGKRKKGQTNQSPEFIQNQNISRQLKPIYHQGLAAINFGWMEKTPRQSRYNAWYGYAAKNFFDLSMPPVATLAGNAVMFTKGFITPTPVLTSAADASARSITITWSAVPIDATQQLTDELVLMALNNTTQTWIAVHSDDSVLSVPRSAGTFTGTVPAGLLTLGDDMNLFAGFRRVVPISGALSASDTMLGFATVAA